MNKLKSDAYKLHKPATIRTLCGLATLILWLCSSFAHAQQVKPGLHENYFRQVISYLASDSMKGRLPGSEEEKRAAAFIAAQLKLAGCKPIKKKFIHPFTYQNPDSAQITSAGNVLGIIDTRSPYCIVVSAHYDHIGSGRHHSKAPFSKQIHNGADDNASGVALLLGLAGWCNQNKHLLNYDVVFAAFSGEEDGLFGSDVFVRSGITDTSKILCNLNFDMLGRLDLLRPLLRIDGATDFAGWQNVLPPDSAKGFQVLQRSNLIKGGSDHCNFSDRHIPALLITTGLHSEYHTPDDDESRINYQGMSYIGEYLRTLMLNLQNRKNLQVEFHAC
ncbi:MAG: M28 family peptidase [Bacteroidia bacterium]|jgi:hypothetical protein|nr:M28 family peptidase [Bacteroidia bacterium]